MNLMNLIPEINQFSFGQHGVNAANGLLKGLYGNHFRRVSKDLSANRTGRVVYKVHDNVRGNRIQIVHHAEAACEELLFHFLRKVQ